LLVPLAQLARKEQLAFKDLQVPLAPQVPLVQVPQELLVPQACPAIVMLLLAQTV
jgi:hypothetical protein